MHHMKMRLGEDEANKWRKKINEKNKRLCADPHCPKIGCVRWETDGEVYYLCRTHYSAVLSEGKEQGRVSRYLMQHSTTAARKTRTRTRAKSAALSMRLAGKSSCETNQALRIVCTKRNCFVLAGGAADCDNSISRYREKSVIDNEHMVEEFHDGLRGKGLRLKETCTMTFESGHVLGSFWARPQSSRKREKTNTLFVLEISPSLRQHVTSSDSIRAGKINHRCANANCRMEIVRWVNDDGVEEHFVAVLAERLISKGDHLSIQYGTKDVVRRFFDSKGEECKCGDERCITNWKQSR